MMTENEDFAALLGEFDKRHAADRQPAVGDKVTGKIVSIQGVSAFVDLGGKTEGMVDLDELCDADGQLSLGVGDAVTMLVSGKDADSGMLLLGAQHARRMRGIDGLRQAYEQQLPVEGLVSATTKGGIEVEISGMRAFCPASQVDIAFVEALDSFVGQHLAFRISKFEGGKHPNLVVSRRALLEDERRNQAAQTREHLQVGVVLKGKVSSLKDFGAFIDLGGIEGMVHVSELSFGRIAHPKELLTVGQEVEVSVLRIDQTDNPKQPERIALSIRALEKSPWQDAASRFAAGSQVEGTVSRIQPFGAFIELEPGLDGLVHISELGAGRRVTHPQEVLSVGQRVQATVLGIDLEKQRISLTLDAAKQTEQIAAQQAVADYAKPRQSFGTLGDLLKASMEKQKR